MNRKQPILRIIRNIAIALLSSAWVITLFSAVSALFVFFRHIEERLYAPETPCSFYLLLSQWFMNITFGLLFLTSFVWFFIVCCLIWPVSCKKEVKENSNL